MNIIAAIDDKQGMMFNKRRQSKDRGLRKNMLSEVGDAKLWMNAYSFEQFEEAMGTNVSVAEDFVDKAEVGEYCFVENIAITEYEGKIENLILYKWNRVYPSDLKLDIDLNSSNWQLVTTEEFEGSSHDKITKEVWKHV
ncbi:MAG: ribonuclease Z [Lachnospiraceae bacterium]|nr:ribonuclease Z [Lachnospiraceae bacterium]